MIRVLRWLIACIPCLILGLAVIYDLNPSGVRIMHYDFSHESPQISRLYPANRLDGVTAQGQKVLAEPVYFRVRYPQTYDQAVVDIRYYNQGQSLVQLGLQVQGSEEWSYFLRPIENSTFDSAPWSRVTSGTMSLWQRQAKFSSVNDFLSGYYDLKVGAYNFNLLRRYSQADYVASSATTTIDRLIRGPWTAYTYVKKEPLLWNLLLVDFNRTVGADPITLIVRDWSGQEVRRWELSDDGRSGNTVGASPLRVLQVRADDLPEGVYSLDWQVDNDIFVTKIETKQHLIAFSDHLYLANNSEYRDGLPQLDLATTTVYTTARSVGISTAHPAGLQTVLVDGKPYELQTIHEPVFAPITSALGSIVMTRADTMLAGDGLFFFDPAQFFNPEVITLKSFDAGLDVDYVIANYVPPTVEADGSHSARVVFDTASAAVDQRALRFMVSAPNYNQQGNELIIRGITVSLYKKPLTSMADIINALRLEFYGLVKTQ